MDFRNLGYLPFALKKERDQTDIIDFRKSRSTKRRFCKFQYPKQGIIQKEIKK